MLAPGDRGSRGGDRASSAEPTDGFDREPDLVTCSYEGSSGWILVHARDGAVFFSGPRSASRIGEVVTDLGEGAFMDNDSVGLLQNDRLDTHPGVVRAESGRHP